MCQYRKLYQHRCAAAAYSQLLQINWNLQGGLQRFFQRNEGLCKAEHLSVFEWATRIKDIMQNCIYMSQPVSINLSLEAFLR